MTRFMTYALLSVLLAATAHGQRNGMDPGVATKVLQGNASAQVISAMNGNQQVALSYNKVAIEQAIAEEAARMGLTERIDVQNALQDARRQILVQARKDELIRQLPAPEEDVLKNVYRENPAQWTMPEAYQLDVWMLDTEDKTQMRRARKLALGTPIRDEDAAAFEGEAIIQQANGRWFTQNLVADEIWNALPDMMTQSAKIFEVNDNTLLVRKGERRQRQLLPFPKVRPTILRLVQQQRAEQLWNNYIEQKIAQLNQ